ncbi:MAG: carboxypeptidase-like regulatory domain-containing protein [Saprospiraceae bacterium]|jgi:hypothetical protein|nr:carboxypeptidase-like regulatory domain-containing protein [Saprospiraceae bacterium]
MRIAKDFFEKHTAPMPVSWLFCAVMLACLPLAQLSGQRTSVRGQVLDAVSREPLPYVSVRLEGTILGTRADIEGNFFIEATEKGLTAISVSYVGYTTQSIPIKAGEANKITVLLEESNVSLKEVTVKVERYRNKGNPAVELIRKAIENKDKNRKEGFNYFQYEKYEKLGMALNNITEKTKNNFIWRNFKFVFDNADTNKVNDKVSLLLYMREKIADVYYRKSPQDQKEYVTGERVVVPKTLFDMSGLTYLIDNQYGSVDFYEADVTLLNLPFVSPLNPIAPNIYRFYIQDTVAINGDSCIHLYFAPRQKTDRAFIGHLWIAHDSTYALRKIEAGIPKEINVNWVNEMQISQEFSWVGTSATERGLMLTKDEVFMDFGITQGDSTKSILGNKTTTYRNYRINQPLPDSLFSTTLATIQTADALGRDTSFWDKKRHVSLSRSEKNLEVTLDSLNKNRTFRQIIWGLKFLFEGYTTIGKFDIGPVNTFYSFNQVEGFRPRIGGRTNYNFSNRLMFEGYVTYGTKDRRWKGFGAARFSFGAEKVRLFPLNEIQVTYQNDTEIPGQRLQLINEDNFLLSYKRGDNSRMFYKESVTLGYTKESRSGIWYGLELRHTDFNGAGSLLFDYRDNGELRYKKDLTTIEVGLSLHYGPNEKFHDGANFRRPIPNKYPIFDFWYDAGVAGLADGEFAYHNLRFRAFKMFYLGPLGRTTCVLEAGRIFGQVPYPMLTIHAANQTFSYQLESYNLMNNLEFVSDKYVSIFAFHNFGGVFFGRIPLLRKLQFREVVSLKALWGGLDDRNKPTDQNKLLLFPTSADGTPVTHTLGSTPYIEASVGVANILKFFRIDIVRRFTYTDHPAITKTGIRMRAKFEF